MPAVAVEWVRNMAAGLSRLFQGTVATGTTSGKPRSGKYHALWTKRRKWSLRGRGRMGVNQRGLQWNWVLNGASH
jgi:hypothetical protein